jgi:hypothetical protein
MNPEYTKYNHRLGYNFGSGHRVEDPLERELLFLIPSYKKHDTIYAHMEYIEKSKMKFHPDDHTKPKWEIIYTDYFDNYTSDQGHICQVYSDQAYL